MCASKVDRLASNGHYAECHCAECRYAECRHADSRGAQSSQSYKGFYKCN
jgi:hypothetical protein